MNKKQRQNPVSDLAVFLKFAPACALGGLSWLALIMLALSY